MTELEKRYVNAVKLNLDKILRDLGFSVIYNGEPNIDHMKTLEKKANRLLKKKYPNIVRSFNMYAVYVAEIRYKEILNELVHRYMNKSRLVLRPKHAIHFVNRDTMSYRYYAIHMNPLSTVAQCAVSDMFSRNTLEVNLDIKRKDAYTCETAYNIMMRIIYHRCAEIIRETNPDADIIVRFSPESGYYQYFHTEFENKFSYNLIGYQYPVRSATFADLPYSEFNMRDSNNNVVELYIMRGKVSDKTAAMSTVSKYINERLNNPDANMDIALNAHMKNKSNWDRLVDFLSPADPARDGISRASYSDRERFNPLYRQIIPAELRSGCRCSGLVAMYNIIEMIGMVNTCRLLNIPIKDDAGFTSEFSGYMVFDYDNNMQEHDHLIRSMFALGKFADRLTNADVTAWSSDSIDLDAIKTQLAEAAPGYDLSDPSVERDLRWAIALGIMFSIVPDRLLYRVNSTRAVPIFVSEIIDPGDHHMPLDEEFCADQIRNHIGASVQCCLPELNDRVCKMLMRLQYNKPTDPRGIITIHPYCNEAVDPVNPSSVTYSYNDPCV